MIGIIKQIILPKIEIEEDNLWAEGYLQSSGPGFAPSEIP